MPDAPSIASQLYNLSSLNTMKQSPYYKNVREFQEEGSRWEEKLSQVQATFDAWVDVQRRWVYLEGIFFGSADIKAQLPAEFSRFKAVDTEFVQLMRRVSQKPLVLEVMNIENLPRQLERQSDLMSRIQKALGEYLEKQRAAFSRFYFVGDEDLLEIIGNGKEPRKVVVHLSKMFAALSARALSLVAAACSLVPRLRRSSALSHLRALAGGRRRGQGAAELHGVHARIPQGCDAGVGQDVTRQS